MTYDRLKKRIDSRLNDYLCEMQPGYDDSITGFHEAWDIVRKVFETEIEKDDADIHRLHTLHDRLLAAAKDAAQGSCSLIEMFGLGGLGAPPDWLTSLQAAIAAIDQY